MTTYPHPACMEPDGGEGPCAGYLALQAKYETEHAIVARVWKALRIPDYAGAKGKAIDELVAEAVEKAWRYDDLNK